MSASNNMYGFNYVIDVYRGTVKIKSASFGTMKSLKEFYKILRKSVGSDVPYYKFYETRFVVSIFLQKYGCLTSSASKCVRLVSCETFRLHLVELHKAATSKYVNKYLGF